MENLCCACLERLPTATDDQSLKDTQYSVDCDENFMIILFKITGIAYNNAGNYSKQLCQKCYMKIMAFDEFRDAALCCATALHELLQEENFSIKTLNNLQYFCCTCLSKLQTLSNTSAQLKNVAWKRWLEECIILKERTAVEQWPSYLCDSCYVKLNDFIEFEQIAKESLKKLETDRIEQKGNKECSFSTQEFDKEKASTKERGINQTSTIIKNGPKDDDSSGAVHYREQNETEIKLVAEQQNANIGEAEIEFDLNEPSNTLDYTRKWVEQTTENALLHCKNKRKQRSRRRKATRNNLKLLGTLTNTSEISANDVSAVALGSLGETAGISLKNDMECEITTLSSCNNQNAENTVTEISEKGTLNNETTLALSTVTTTTTLAKSVALVESNTIIGPFEDEKGKELRDKNSDSKILENGHFIDTNTSEDVSMVSNNKLISMVKFNNCNDSYKIIGEEEKVKELKGKISENGNFIDTNSTEDVLTSSNNKLISNTSTVSGVIVETNNSAVLKRKHSDELTTEISIPNQKGPKKNILKASSSKMRGGRPAKIEIAHESTTDMTSIIAEDIDCNSENKDADGPDNKISPPINASKDKSTFDDLLAGSHTAIGQKRKHSDAIIAENATVKQKSSKQNISKVVKTKLKSKKPSKPNKTVEIATDNDKPIENAELKSEENNTTMTEGDILHQQASTKGISQPSTEPISEKPLEQDVLIERPTDIDCTHVEDGEQKNKNSDAQIAEDYILSQPSSSQNLAKASKNLSKRDTLSENPTDLHYRHAEKSDAQISTDVIPKQPGRSNNITQVSNKNSTSRNPPKRDISAASATDIDFIHVEDVERKDEGIDAKTSEDEERKYERGEAEVSEDTIPSLTESIAKASQAKSTTKKLAKSVVFAESPSDIGVCAEHEGEGMEKKNSEISSTNNFAEATNDKCITKKPTNEDILAENPRDTDSMHVEDAGLDDEKVHTEISDYNVIKDPNSPTNDIMQVDTKSPSHSTDSDSAHVDDLGLKDKKVDDGIPADINLNQPIQTKNKEKVSTKNITSKKKSKRESSRANRNLHVENVEPKDKIICAEICQDANLNPPSLTNQLNSEKNIGDGSNNKSALNVDIAADSPADIDYALVEDVRAADGESNAETLADEMVNQPGQTKNIAKALNKNPLSNKKLKQDISVENFTDNDPIQGEDAMRKDKERDADISKDSIQQQPSSENTIKKVPKNKPISKKLAKPVVSSESSVDKGLVAKVEGLENTNNEVKNSMDTMINQLSSTNNITESTNDKWAAKKPTDESILAESPTDIDCTHVEDVGLKVEKYDRITSEKTISNQPSSAKTITKTSKKKQRSKKMVKPFVSAESSSGIALITEDERLEDKNKEAENSTGPFLNQGSIANNIAKASNDKCTSEKPSKGDISAESLTDNFSTRVENVEEKRDKSDANTSSDDIIYQVDQANVNKLSAKKKSKQDMPVESPKDSDPMQIECAGRTDEKNDFEIPAVAFINQPSPTNNKVDASKNKLSSENPIEKGLLVESLSDVDGRHADNVGLNDEKIDTVTSEDYILNSAMDLTTASNKKPSSNKPPKPDTATGSSRVIDFESVPDVELKDGGNDAMSNADTILQQPTSTENPIEINSSHTANSGLNIDAEICEEAILNKTRHVAKASQAKATSNKPATTVRNPAEIDTMQVENLCLKSERNGAEISKDAIIIQTSSTKNMAKASKTKTISKKQSKRETTAERPTANDSMYVQTVELKEETCDKNIIENNFIKKRSSKYNDSGKSNKKSSSDEAAKSETRVEGFMANDWSHEKIIGQHEHIKHALTSENVHHQKAWMDDDLMPPSKKSTSKEKERSYYSAEEPYQHHRSTKSSLESNKRMSHNPSKSDKLYKNYTDTSFTAYEGRKEKNKYTHITGDSYGNEKNSSKNISYNKWSNNPTKSDIYVDAPTAINTNFAVDASYYRRDPIAHRIDPFRNPDNPDYRHYSMPHHTYGSHEMSPSAFTPYAMQNYYQCLACMKTFKRREHLHNHRRFSPRCSRIL